MSNIIRNILLFVIGKIFELLAILFISINIIIYSFGIVYIIYHYVLSSISFVRHFVNWVSYKYDSLPELGEVLIKVLIIAFFAHIYYAIKSGIWPNKSKYEASEIIIKSWYPLFLIFSILIFGNCILLDAFTVSLSLYFYGMNYAPHNNALIYRLMSYPAIALMNLFTWFMLMFYVVFVATLVSLIPYGIIYLSLEDLEVSRIVSIATYFIAYLIYVYLLHRIGLFVYLHKKTTIYFKNLRGKKFMKIIASLNLAMSKPPGDW
jgi:hypothetical protein